MDLGRHHAPLADELRAAFERVLGASSFILGEEVERFETQFADYCGVRHCVGVGSGTAALTIMLQGAGIGPGDEVVVPAHTFIATALAVVHVGATPVYADVLSDTGLIDPEAVGAAIGPATAAILPVHLYGQPCAMEELSDLAARHGLALFEDAAQAHGALYGDARAGSIGRAGAFSFYPSKNLGALGDGGAICTDDAELAERARSLRDLGRARGGVHELSGYNERLDGLQAALLRVKLPHLDRWNEERRARASNYRERLEGQVELLGEARNARCVYHLFPIRVADREGLAESLAGRGIATGVHYDRALPDQPALPGIGSHETPVARDWSSRELSLPMFPELTDRELEMVAESLLRST
jgi:dTDP-4-amino-4,6-dideoxygalactose transaminase